MFVYYPSCTFKKTLPKTAEAVIDYLKNDMMIAGCCRAKNVELKGTDTAVVICGSCRSTLEKSANVISLWEYLLSKNDFVFPNYRGFRVNVQDCWRNREQPVIHKAVRAILDKMNICVVPVSESFDKADFCGTLHYDVKDKELKEKILTYGEKPLYELPTQLQAEAMRDRVKAYNCECVVCDCTTCLLGIQMGGGKGIHLLELVFQTVDRDKLNN